MPPEEDPNPPFRSGDPLAAAGAFKIHEAAEETTLVTLERELGTRP